MLQLPEKCPECGKRLEYLSDVQLCDVDPLEAEMEGTCYGCGSIVTSKFKMYEAEVTLFDEHGNETGKKII